MSVSCTGFFKIFIKIITNYFKFFGKPFESQNAVRSLFINLFSINLCNQVSISESLNSDSIVSSYWRSRFLYVEQHFDQFKINYLVQVGTDF
jgi:hypothetical protein